MPHPCAQAQQTQRRVGVSTPSPGEVLTPDPTHFSLEGRLLLTLNGTLQLAQASQLGRCTQGASNLSLHPGPTPVTLWAQDYLPAPWLGTSCRAA